MGGRRGQGCRGGAGHGDPRGDKSPSEEGSGGTSVGAEGAQAEGRGAEEWVEVPSPLNAKQCSTRQGNGSQPGSGKPLIHGPSFEKQPRTFTCQSPNREPQLGASVLSQNADGAREAR